jgi:hypothetical protein
MSSKQVDLRLSMSIGSKLIALHWMSCIAWFTLTRTFSMPKSILSGLPKGTSCWLILLDHAQYYLDIKPNALDSDHELFDSKLMVRVQAKNWLQLITQCEVRIMALIVCFALFRNLKELSLRITVLGGRLGDGRERSGAWKGTRSPL